MGRRRSVVIVKKTFRYLNVFSTTVHPFMPQFRNSEHYYEKRYNDLKTINRLIQKRIALGTYLKNSRSRSLFSRSAGDMRIGRLNF
jgi:hypothetical protein